MTRYATSPLPADLAASHPRDGQGASEKQVNFIASLVAERDLTDEIRATFAERIAAQRAAIAKRGDRAWSDDGISLRRASEFIERLKQLPKPPAKTKPPVNHMMVPRISPADVPAGHYAVKNDDGELRFYSVWWAPEQPGQDPFFKLYVAHGDDDSEVPFRGALAILRKIAEDPATAARTYGLHIGSCSRCSRRLTNRISRLLSIGPVCGGHFYDDEIWTTIKSKARAALREAGLDPDADVEDTDDLDAIRERIGL